MPQRSAKQSSMSQSEYEKGRSRKCSACRANPPRYWPTVHAVTKRIVGGAKLGDTNLWETAAKFEFREVELCRRCKKRPDLVLKGIWPTVVRRSMEMQIPPPSLPRSFLTFETL
jgi:hypothetical protein